MGEFHIILSGLCILQAHAHAAAAAQQWFDRPGRGLSQAAILKLQAPPARSSGEALRS